MLLARLSLAALLLGSLLLGIGQIALLPPYEGADELAHYSYIQQIAETARPPKIGEPMSREIDQYWVVGPLPQATGAPLSYRTFFASSVGVITRAGSFIREPRDPSRGWEPGESENWQAQHPPLYYAVVSPLYLLTKGWSLAEQLLLLRLFSYLMAWSALVVCVAVALGALWNGGVTRNAMILAPALWPALFPGWFPEMARLGNDSLVVLIAALTWAVLVHIQRASNRALPHIVLGLLCGLGLLTKAIMAPFVIVVAAYLVVRAWSERRAGLPFRDLVTGVILFGVTVFLVAGWWYLLSLSQTGNMIGSIDGFRLDAAGGLLKGLREYLTPREFSLGLLMTLLTFLWGGTWSFVMPALWLYAPLIVMLVLFAIGWCVAIRIRFDSMQLVSAGTLALFGAGLFRHALVLTALGGAGFAGGWYLHAMMPVLAPALGLAMAGAIKSRLLRWPARIVMLYPASFLVFAMAGQATYFAGCGVQRPGFVADGFFAGRPCGLDVAILYDRLSVLAYPGPASVFIALGAMLLVFGVIAALLALRPIRPKQA